MNLTYLVLLYLLPVIILSEAENEKDKKSDYYTSLIGIQNLAKLEQQVVRRMASYRKILEERVNLIDSFLDDYVQSVRPLIQSSDQLRAKYGSKRYPVIGKKNDLNLLVDKTSANPLVVFKLLRRFAKQLADIAVKVLNDDTESDDDFRVYLDSLPDNHTVPTEQDIGGAAEGILRVQQTYQLPTRDLVDGILIDKNTGCKLSASDSHHIGVRSFDKREYATSVEWLYFSFQKVLAGDKSISKGIVENDLRMLTNYHNAAFITFHPGYTNLFSNLVNENITNIPGLYITPTTAPGDNLRISGDNRFDYHNYRALCRGEKFLTPSQTKNLRCFYSHKKSPVNTIGPLKVEVLYEDPPIFQIYDLLSDRVIELLKQWAEPKLTRATVGATTIRSTSDIRTSSTAWLNEKSEAGLSKIPQIVQRATGLNVLEDGATEELQLSCYGSIGGHYDPHKDPIFKPGREYNEAGFERGDRMATLMFYLTDVELGGGTAFPKLGVLANAKKGSAVFWYNLRRNGLIELLMLHGGCPVLLGNKWVANKWIRMNPQMESYKCSLNRFE